MPRTLLAVISVLVACAQPAPTPGPNASLLAAQCTRAENLLGAGDADSARRLASETLERARATADTTSEARARHILGLIDGDREQLVRAVAILEQAEPGPELWNVRLGLARAALAAGDDDAALQQLERVDHETRDWPDIFQRARTQAPVHHLVASILRRRHEDKRARARQRQANLSLSLLPPDEAVSLRAAVAMGLGDDLAGQRAFTQAFEAHAQASSLYRRLGLRKGELRAQRSLSEDLAGLGRLLDAVDQAGRALRTALADDDAESARAIAQQAIAWLDTLRMPPESRRRRAFDEALDQLAPTETPRP